MSRSHLPLSTKVPESSRGSPFTVSGSVQQVYLVRLQDDFVNELAQRFPELAAHLPSVRAAARSTSTPLEAPMPAELFRDFANAVEDSGLRFPAGSNLVRSFVSSLLAKPFVILTGLAGSGKTQLAMRLGEWFGTDEHGRHRHVVVPVRPDWTGCRIQRSRPRLRVSPRSHTAHGWQRCKCGRTTLPRPPADQEHKLRDEKRPPPETVIQSDGSLARMNLAVSAEQRRGRHGGHAGNTSGVPGYSTSRKLL